MSTRLAEVIQQRSSIRGHVREAVMRFMSQGITKNFLDARGGVGAQLFRQTHVAIVHGDHPQARICQSRYEWLRPVDELAA